MFRNTFGITPPSSDFAARLHNPAKATSIKKWIAYGLIFHIYWVSASVIAQTGVSPSTVPPRQAAEEGLRRQEERAREQQQQLQPDVTVLRPGAKTEKITELPSESPCFVIKETRFTGSSAIRFNWLQDEIRPFLNQCIGVNGLNYLASILDAKLIEWGYVTTKVTLPAQNLADGILTFNLHVGRISDIRMVRAGANGEPDNAWGIWQTAFPLSEGGILNVRDLEQGAEQMQRLPSQAIQTRLEPGGVPDTTVVVIERQSGTLKDRIRGGITVDNSGSEALGRTQASGYLAFDNPLGLNDLVNLSASSNAENPDARHRTQSWSFSYSIPFGYSTLSYSKSYSRFAQIVQGTTVHFLSSGESWSDEARLHRTFLRTSSAKFGLYAALSTRRASSFLDDVELIVQRRRTTNLEIGGTFRKLIGDASLDMEAGYRRGVPWRDAQEDFPEETGITLRPRIWIASVNFAKPFKLADQPFQYSAALRAQYTNDTTSSVDQIAIGSRYSVRGFDGDSVLLAEKGFYWRNDLAMPLKLVENLHTQAYLGIDMGRVWGPSEINLVGDKLAGAVIGLRGQWQSLQFDVALGTPLYKPSGFDTRHLNPYLSATYAF